MIFYLEHAAKFHIYYNTNEVIYVEYEDAMLAPKITTVRWLPKSAFKNEHIESIISYLISEEDVDRDIGKKLLEETLKINIHGDIVGHYEGSSI